MMSIQSIGCQPLKPMCGNNHKVQSFGNGCYESDNDYSDCYEGDIEAIKQDRAEFAEMAKNKDSKFLSTILSYNFINSSVINFVDEVL